MASEKHAKLYFKEYGFEPIEKIWMSDIGADEQILLVSSWVLAKKLRLQIETLEKFIDSRK